MKQTQTYILALLTLVCSTRAPAAEPGQRIQLKDGWSEQHLAAFTAGCAAAIIDPAKRDYAAAAARAGNSSPKPFPEEELRASVAPMCGCLSERIAETWSFSDYMTDSQVKSRPLIEEALRGGQCKPEGILWQLLSSQRK